MLHSYASMKKAGFRSYLLGSTNYRVLNEKGTRTAQTTRTAQAPIHLIHTHVPTDCISLFGIPSCRLMLYDIYYSMYKYEGNAREKDNEFHINVQ